MDCNDQGAEFIHAKVDIKMQDILAPGVYIKVVNEFIPPNKLAVEHFTDPLLAIQVTMFKCGGVALGVSTTHKIIDASNLSRGYGPKPGPIIRDELSSKLYIRKKVSFSESEISILKAKAMSNGKLNTFHLSKV
ncbi:Chloramphenicol acetyltransferase-like domain-containing protein [Artemisia annua]|uniref:Chloramphenicol acetyltransferase-like domain-containing protein n=1 Tax=Artemisia annua TaxID=35608 RepID=A0A2U1PSJ5_ARTAN|nr:Chloramphenicol acetyltransferase-like domain-containing protein [Artemisia annua]